MGFRGMRFVVHVKGFGGMKITYEILSEYLNAVKDRIILEHTLNFSAMAYQLETSDTVYRTTL